MSDVVTVGVDLAKNVFQVHGALLQNTEREGCTSRIHAVRRMG